MEEELAINLRPAGLAPMQGAQISVPSASQTSSVLQSGLSGAAGVAAATNPITAGIAAFAGLVGLFQTIDANKDAKRKEREAREAARRAAERFDNYASNFDIPSMQGGTSAEIRERLEKSPSAVFDPSLQLGSFSTPGNFAGGLQLTPGFDTNAFKLSYDPATGELVSTTTTPQGKTSATRSKAVTLGELKDLNLDGAKIQQGLDMMNRIDGILDVP